MTERDGGQAFPVAGLSQLPNGDFIHPGSGMSLRDWFAGKAMQGDWATQNDTDGHYPDDSSLEDFAVRARLFYRMADAMIIERAKDPA